MRTITAVVVSIALFAPAAGAQRVYIAPISDFAVGDAGPTRYEYITELGRQESCETVSPTNRRDYADYEVWFEFESAVISSHHFMILWDSDAGTVIAMGNAVLSENIVKDACDAMIEHVRQEEYGPPVKVYENCVDLRDAGWTLGVHQDGGTYQESFDDAERETYTLNAELDRNTDGRLCNLA